MQAKIGQQEAKILKLEESVRINRNINEVLMKKEKEIEYKLKAFQDQSDKIMKQKVNEAKEHSK